MLSWRGTFALAVSLLSGCADNESRSVEPVDAGSGAYDTNAQAKVLNVGAACSTERDCRGLAPQCQTTAAFGAVYQGGMCTAPCTSDLECGLDAKCPLSPLVELAARVPLLTPLVTQLSTCLVPCANEGACRAAEGYHCQSLQRLLDANAGLLGGLGGGSSQASMIPGVIDTFCLPLAVPDAGVGGLDAGLRPGAPVDASFQSADASMP